MIKVYLDWNVIAQMKNGFHRSLFKVLSNKDKFLIPYSTSHIEDIFSSYSEDFEQRKRIDEDLEFISLLSDNLCLSNTNKEIILDNSNPKVLFQQKIDDKDFFKNFSLETLEDIFSEDKQTKKIGKAFVSLLKSIPLDIDFKNAIKNAESGKYLYQMFPELKDNMTLGDFFNSFGKMYQNLNEKEDYKKLREIIQKGLGIKRDKIFNDDNPYKIIDNAHNKLNLSINEYIDNSKNAPEWFNKISNEYIMLDMHGYQEDKVRVKENKRKETFKNTTEDAFHSAFASTCNFYIINDNKSYKKTRQIYERLNINTAVFKPNDFLDLHNKFFNVKNTAEYFKKVVDIIRTNNFVESKVENGVFKTYIFPEFIFDFFNKIVMVEYNNTPPIIILSKLFPTNCHETHLKEVKKLVEKLNTFFGYDIDNIGDFKYEEFSNGKWIGRIWELNNIQYRLINDNGYFQLYFDFI